nr:hypothetical protein HmN_000147600 [Hymenolepis microstoma]
MAKCSSMELLLKSADSPQQCRGTGACETQFPKTAIDFEYAPSTAGEASDRHYNWQEASNFPLVLKSGCVPNVKTALVQLSAFKLSPPSHPDLNMIDLYASIGRC